MTDKVSVAHYITCYHIHVNWKEISQCIIKFMFYKYLATSAQAGVDGTLRLELHK